MTHYELLGISPDATREEIKHAYRKRALQTHPDLRKGRPAEIKRAGRQFVRISKAYKTLIDPQQRVRYDDRLHERAGATAVATKEPHVDQRGRRIVPSMPLAPAEPAHVREDLREIDDLHRQIWEEPREVLIRQLILYLVFLAALPLGLYSLIQEANSRVLDLQEWLFIPASCGLGVWVAYSTWLRFLRIRASGGLIAFWKSDRRHGRRSRRWSSAQDLSLSLWHLLLLFALVGASITLLTLLGGEELSRLSPIVFVLVASLITLAVLSWRAFGRR